MLHLRWLTGFWIRLLLLVPVMCHKNILTLLLSRTLCTHSRVSIRWVQALLPIFDHFSKFVGNLNLNRTVHEATPRTVKINIWADFLSSSGIGIEIVTLKRLGVGSVQPPLPTCAFSENVSSRERVKPFFLTLNIVSHIFPGNFSSCSEDLKILSVIINDFPRFSSMFGYFDTTLLQRN